MTETLILLWLVIGLVPFPLALLVLAIWGEKSLRKLLKLLWTSEDLPQKYNEVLADQYNAVTFAPNIVGAAGAGLAQLSGNLGVPSSTLVAIFYSNLALLVLSAVGIGLLKVARQRVGLVFLGEYVSTWAFVSGSLVFVNLLIDLSSPIGEFLVGLISGLILLFLIIVMYFVVARSVGTYVSKVT